MIKIENDIYYMTAGETCMILKNDGGTLKNIYFGRRVELEDDLAALGYGSIETEETYAVGGVPLKIVGAAVQAETDGAAFLGGGKTLVISMLADSADIAADVYYTPHARGGFSRRTVITNNGDKPIAVSSCNNTAIGGIKELVCISADGDGKTVRGSTTDKKRRVDNFLAAKSNSGDAYGFLCAYGDGEVCGKVVDGVARITVADGELALGSGERYVSPELLAVFSDCGLDGMSRVLHDILRGDTEELAERRPIVLFCPEMSEKKTAEAADAATELGCDVFAVDVGAVTRKALDGIVGACREAGIKPGISVSPDRIKQKSALYSDKCVGTDDEYYSVNLGDSDCADGFAASVIELIEALEIEYLMIDVPLGGLGKKSKGLCRVRRALAERLGDIVTEWGIVPEKERASKLLCYPPCLTRNVVEMGEGSLKTAFDTATVGCLGYRLDPLALSAEVKRAIRAQVFSYQDDAPTVMLGDLYRAEGDGTDSVLCVTKDKSRAYVVCTVDGEKPRAELRGLDEHNLYHVRELNKTFSGAALMAIGVPIPEGAKTFCLHIRQVADYE